MTRKLFRLFGCLLLAACAMSSAAVETAKSSQGLVYDVSGVRLGHWTKDYKAARAYSEANHVPMICFWGQEDCGYCHLFQKDVLLDSKFSSWVSKHQVVMLFVEAGSDTSMTDVKGFIWGKTKDEQKDWSGKWMGDWPFMRLYWPKTNGTTLSVRFIGRKDKMPVKDGKRVEQFVGTLNKYIGSYTPAADYTGGYFAVTNLPAARLEAVPGKTKAVDIPMFRTETKTVGTNKLQIAGGDLITIAWKANETNKVYKYTVPGGKAAGDVDALKLYAADGKTLKSESAINYVEEPANSISNPKWIGVDFGVGEWTMDLSKALEKAGKDKKFYTLAVVGGDMWCPYCQGLRDGVFSKTDFTNWAKTKNVNLVCIDMPQKGTTCATLLTRDLKTRGEPASGAAYLSRNMIADDKAKEIFDRNKTLSGSTWKPKASSAERLGNPTVLLLNADGTVAGRLYDPTETTTYPLKETLDRLTELLLLRDAKGRKDADSDIASTTLTMDVGTSVTGELQVNDHVKFYKLTNVPTGKVLFTNDCVRPLRLSVCEYPGTGAFDEEKQVIAVGHEAVLVTFLDTANKYLRVEGFMTCTNAYGTGTKTTYTISSALTLIPSETKKTYVCASGEVLMEVVADELYKLNNFSDYSAFDKVGDFYKAKATATLKMTCAKNAKVEYQKWAPGSVQFGAATLRLMEKNKTATMTVKRTGGVSGAACVTVAIDDGSRGEKRVTLSPAEFSWAEGESADKTLTFTVSADPAFNPDERYAVTLTKKEPSDASLGTPASLQLTISDTNDPVFSADDFSVKCLAKMPYEAVYPLNNILENKKVAVSVASGKLPRGLSVSYSYDKKAVVISGKPSAVGKSTFSLAVSETRSGKRVTGQAAKFVYTVLDSTALKPGQEFYNAALAAGTAIDCTVPLYGLYNGYDVVAGSVRVKVSKSYRVSAKYEGSDKKVSFSGNLPTVAESGDCAGSFAKKDARLNLRIASDGKVYATVSGVNNVFGKTLQSPAMGVRAIVPNCSAYAGYYTVTLPAYRGEEMPEKTAMPLGTGYLVLKMESSTFEKKGKVSFKGVLADGKSVSGSSNLLPDQYTDLDGVKWGALPIFVSKSSGTVLSACLFIRKGAKADFKDDPRAVVAEPASSAYWRSDKTFWPLDVWGGYFKKGADPKEVCEDLYETDSFDLVCDTSAFSASEKYGELVSVSSGTATMTSSGRMTITGGVKDLPATLKVNPDTGIVTGSIYAKFASGKKQKLTVKGAILFGWGGCEAGCGEGGEVSRPVVSAAAYYSDKIDGKSAKRGFAVELTELLK